MDAGGKNIFIAYSREDGEAAKQISASLNRLGAPAVCDTDAIASGSSWPDDLERQLAESRAGVVLLTPALFSSHFASRELSALLRREQQTSGFDVIPVMLKLTDPPAFLRGRPYIDAQTMTPSRIAEEIVRSFKGQAAPSTLLSPTGPAEYAARLGKIKDLAEREERRPVIDPKALTRF